MIDDRYKIDICDYVNAAKPDDVVVDLRDPYIFEFGTLKGAVNIPMDRIRQLYHLPRDRKIYVFCQVGKISEEIVELLLDAGYEAYHLSGGYREYLRRVLAEETDGVSDRVSI